jgi:hypothetical protein
MPHGDFLWRPTPDFCTPSDDRSSVNCVTCFGRIASCRAIGASTPGTHCLLRAARHHSPPTSNGP